MSAELIQALDAVAQRVMVLAAKDAELQAHLRALAQAILSATAEPPATVAVLVEPPAAPAAEKEMLPPGPAVVEQPAMPAPTLPPPEEAAHSLAQTAAFAKSAPPSQAVQTRERTSAPPPASDIDLRMIEARCRLKAEGTRWSVTRRRRLAEGADFRTEIEPQDRDIIARAKELPDCFLWMNTPGSPSAADHALLDNVAGSFEAVADAIALVRTVVADLENHQDVFGRVLELTAEAQSALRAAIMRIDGPHDRDQLQAWVWLKETAAEQQIFIRRFMRVDDPADPRRWGDIAARIDALGAQLEEGRKRARQRKKLLGNLRYKIQKVTDEGEDEQESWQTIAATVDALVQAGVPPSNLEIRELLLPVLDEMPEPTDMPFGFRLVLREIDAFLASRPPATGVVVLSEPTPDVKQVARILGGKSVVLIGGEPRTDALESLKAAFGLKELYWIATREHQSLEGFEAYVARQDVCVILLAIRWSSHSFGDVKQFCDRHGKPLVRLPAGYNPNQVARQVLLQCGERLAATS